MTPSIEIKFDYLLSSFPSRTFRPVYILKHREKGMVFFTVMRVESTEQNC